jgi:hypothetical protein
MDSTFNVPYERSFIKYENKLSSNFLGFKIDLEFNKGEAGLFFQFPETTIP